MVKQKTAFSLDFIRLPRSLNSRSCIPFQLPAHQKRTCGCASLATTLPDLLRQEVRAFHCFHTRLGNFRPDRKLPGGVLLSHFCTFRRRTRR